MPRPGEVVAFVDHVGLVHDAQVVSVINDGKPLNALTVRTLDDGVEHSNVQHAEERPLPTDVRVKNGHIDGGHWRLPTDAEKKAFASHADRRAKRDLALANQDTSPKKGESAEETKTRVEAERATIVAGALEPALVVDETPWPGESPAQTTDRVAAAKKALAATS
jgi:hypothetical protein